MTDGLNAVYIHYRLIVRFPIGLDFLFITFTFLLHILLSWTSSLSIGISTPTLSWSSKRSSAFNSILHTFLHQVLITFSHHMSIPSQSTTSNESCDRLNSNHPSQFVKLLGVYLDTFFSFNTHCVQVANRVSKRNNVLKALAGTNWGQQKETLMLTYKALGRSIANYAAPV